MLVGHWIPTETKSQAALRILQQLAALGTASQSLGSATLIEKHPRRNFLDRGVMKTFPTHSKHLRAVFLDDSRRFSRRQTATTCAAPRALLEDLEDLRPDTSHRCQDGAEDDHLKVKNLDTGGQSSGYGP